MELEPTPVADRTDPVHRFAGAASAALDRVQESPTWAMTPAEQAETLLELSRAQAGLTELRWRVLAAADRNQLGEGRVDRHRGVAGRADPADPGPHQHRPARRAGPGPGPARGHPGRVRRR